MKQRSIALFTALLLAPSACTLHQADLPQASEDEAYLMYRGSYEIGYEIFEHETADKGPLEIKAWYPASVEGESWPDLTYTVKLESDGLPEGTGEIFGNGHRSAEPNTESTYPLIVFSHGYGANPEWYHQLAEHLASQGTVVLAPQHSEYYWEEDIIASSVARPADISATIDFAEGNVLGGIIDAERVAVAGHSYGGYTALAVGGARIDLTALEERCAGEFHPINRTFFCGPFVDHGQELADELGLDSVPAGLWPRQRDDRVDAIIAMAGDAYLFGKEGLAAVDIPVFLLGGTGDSGTPWEWGAGLAWDNVSSSTKTLVAFEGAEHMLPATSCDRMPWTDDVNLLYHGIFCGETGWEKASAMPYINQLTTAFVFANLDGNEDARQLLEPSRHTEVEGLEIQSHF